MEKIELTEELKKILNKIEDDSKVSNHDLIENYLTDDAFQKYCANLKVRTNEYVNEVKKIRELNPNLSDDEFFKVFIDNKAKEIVNSIKSAYSDVLTSETEDRLNKFTNSGISVINNDGERGDLTAFPELGEITINLAHFARDKTDIESKIVRAMGTLPHELFHFIYRILKDEDKCEEQMLWNLKDNTTGICQGMVGYMLNEGVVEYFSSKFCDELNIFYTIGPSYIQFAKLVDYIINSNPDINKEFFLRNDYGGILDLFTE